MDNNEEKLFYEIKEEYHSFRDNLIKKIKDNKVSLQNEECYLIQDNIEEKLVQIFNKIEKQLKESRSKRYAKIDYDCFKDLDISFVNNMSYNH